MTDKGHKSPITLLLIAGIFASVISQIYMLANPISEEARYRGYTFGAYIGLCLVKVFSYALILGIVSSITAFIIKYKSRKHKFTQTAYTIFAWLFLIAGLFDICTTIFLQHVRIEIDKVIIEYPDILSEKVNSIDIKQRLLGHWLGNDGITHTYFSPKNITIVLFGEEKVAEYEVIESNQDEAWIKIKVTGADFIPHTRTYYFEEGGVAWVIIDLSTYGPVKSKQKYVDSKQKL